MSAISEGTKARSYWFVGATYDSNSDQMPRFITEGIWENGYEDRYHDLVKSMQPGDRIAIKATYTRKHDLPFDNPGQSVSVMAIKAIGTVTENLGDGYKVKVEWTPLDSPREWYFFTHRGTVWRVLPGDWMKDELIEFAFNGQEQDITRFRNEPYWRDRYGDDITEKRRFQWTKFYEEIADKLLAFRNDRSALVKGIHDIVGSADGLSNLQDQFSDGTSGPLRDICPFTTIGIFNRGISDNNRKIIATKLAKLLGVEEAVPKVFDGIPVLSNFKSWYFGYEKDRQHDDIDALWEVFAAALNFTESDDAEIHSVFAKAFDNAIGRQGVSWNLTLGLYWIRPWRFPTLDKRSRDYISQKLKMQIPLTSFNAVDYFNIADSLEARFQEEIFPVHSFPELSLAAWRFEGIDVPQQDTREKGTEDGGKVEAPPLEPYSIDDILVDGCFIGRNELEKILERLRTKKNLILQGPPGTGKTWLAKRLAYALMGERDENRIRAVQFHPNLSYEDFVRGWRPSGEGKLSLVDGPLMKTVNAALKKPSVSYVVVIEEINRGNPAQIFGEMLTLMEVDKRTPTEALELCYSLEEGERVYIPDNLYIIGTMNIADRSLALVDLALRRRFAFVGLEPRLDKPWRDWVMSRCGIDLVILDEIEKRIHTLNERISSDPNLGRQFCIGHSYVTPPLRIPIKDPREWFKQVVETEIGPLLEEYWFDAIDKANTARKQLLENF